MKKDAVYEGEKSKLSWILGIIAGFVPLIVRLRAMEVPEAGIDVWDNGTGLYADFFSINKVIALGVLTVLALIVFIFEYKKEIHSNNNQAVKIIDSNKLIYILLGIYLGLAFLSTLFAKSGTKMITLLGSPGRYEGLIAIASYIIIMMLAINIGQEWWNVKLVYKILALGSFILGVIGVCQFFGWDFLQSDGGKTLMLPFEFRDLAGDINFAFAGRVYATLFNPNYVGSYAAILMPISLTAVIYTYLYVKDKTKKLNATIYALVMIALWLTCYSRGGLLGGSFALIIMIILLNKSLIKTKGQLAALIIITLVGAVGLNFVSKGAILKRIQTLPKQAQRFISSDQEDLPQLTDIRLDGKAVEVDSNLPTFRIELKEDYLMMKDKDGHSINLTEKDNKYIPEDEKFSGLNIQWLSDGQFRVNIKNPHQSAHYSIYLANTAEGLRVIGHANGLYDIVQVPSWGFKGKEKLGSSRGYIWSRTIPMIGDKWLLGYGLDTYAINFPQHDIVGKINAYGRTNIITDKPHNLYLQTMVSTGIPSMLVLIAVFIIYIIRYIKFTKTMEKDDMRRWMSAGIFSALCGYLVAGFFNDSVVSVAPVFWILWGLGIGLTNSKGLMKKV